MDPENENIDLFEAYLSGSASEKERSDFEGQLISDAGLKKNFEEYKSLRAGLKKYYRDQIKSRFTAIDQQLDEQKKKGKIYSYKWWLTSGIAAILILGLFLFRDNSSSSVDFVAKYWPYESGLPVQMSEKRKYDNAMNAFKLEEWEKAEALLKPIDSDTAHYYLGVVNYELKEYSKSMAYFEKLDANSSFYDETQFRMALLSILKNDLVLAKNILETQVEKETTFSDEAEAILKELK